MLIDLGTNGEMAIGNCEKLLVTSAAAGPAFEGGNITWGTGSVQGGYLPCCLRKRQIEDRNDRRGAAGGNLRHRTD